MSTDTLECARQGTRDVRDGGHAARPDGVIRRVGNGRRNAQFVDMMMAFRGHGGMLRSPEVGDSTGSRRRRVDAPCEQAPAAPQLICFDWDASSWVPMFQFEPDTSRVRARVRCVVERLPGAFSHWDVSVWFATPNRWLNLQRPVALVAGECDRVCAAAGLTRVIG